ncbi:MAG: hypothetical protein HC794_01470 [Nitrospiraceae bacterium]|nr:hypothetical protein [Nitrospiraceae bacterium]
MAEDIIAGDAVIEVVNGALFPAPAAADEIATVILRDVAEGKFEIMNITSRSGNFLTVERGAEGTTADNWTAGTKIRHGVTAAFFDRFISRARRVRFVEADTYSSPGPQIGLTISLTPNLPSAVEGDMVIAYMITRGQNPDGAQPTATEWNKLTIGDWGFGDSIFNGLNSGAPVLAAFRFIEAVDTNPPFTFVIDDVDNGYAMIFSLYRNVSLLRPITQRVIAAGVMELESQNAFSPPPDMIRASPASLSLNFFYGVSNTSASYGPHDGIQPYKAAAGEVKEEFVLAFGGGGSTARSISPQLTTLKRRSTTCFRTARRIWRGSGASKTRPFRYSRNPVRISRFSTVASICRLVRQGGITRMRTSTLSRGSSTPTSLHYKTLAPLKYRMRT